MYIRDSVVSQVGALHAPNMKQMGECPGCDPPTARIPADKNRSIAVGSAGQRRVMIDEVRRHRAELAGRIVPPYLAAQPRTVRQEVWWLRFFNITHSRHLRWRVLKRKFVGH